MQGLTFSDFAWLWISFKASPWCSHIIRTTVMQLNVKGPDCNPLGVNCYHSLRTRSITPTWPKFLPSTHYHLKKSCDSGKHVFRPRLSATSFDHAFHAFQPCLPATSFSHAFRPRLPTRLSAMPSGHVFQPRLPATSSDMPFGSRTLCFSAELAVPLTSRRCAVLSPPIALPHATDGKDNEVWRLPTAVVRYPGLSCPETCPRGLVVIVPRENRYYVYVFAAIVSVCIADNSSACA